MESNYDRIKAIELALKLFEICGPAVLDLTKNGADPTGKLVEAAERIERFFKPAVPAP